MDLNEPILLKHTHGVPPVDLRTTDVAELIREAYMMTGERAKAIYVHPKIYRQIVVSVDKVEPIEFYGCRLCQSFAVPLWAIAISDEVRLTQLFNYVTGKPIKMEVP